MLGPGFPTIFQKYLLNSVIELMQVALSSKYRDGERN